MERRKVRVRDHCYGTLPARAPLANPYVPFQSDDPKRYETRMGFVRGTLYPGLDLPFKGMVNNREKPVTPKTEMQTLAFAVQELSMYLDTHPNDQQALALYTEYQKAYHDSVKSYSEKISPVNHMHGANGKEYNWLQDPWPWEFAANKEG